MTDVKALISVSLDAISKMSINDNGDVVRTYDPEEMKHRLQYIDTDNFAAFLKTHKDTLTWCEHLADTTSSILAEPIVKLFTKWTNNYMISITGKSSEGGKFLKLLANDTSEQRITYKGLPEDKSKVRRFFENKTDPQDNNENSQKEN